ncbi:MAG: 4Fe-4S dicluster domain-containing protein, partial [Candidatus Bathyarchaeia archaeon]
GDAIIMKIEPRLKVTPKTRDPSFLEEVLKMQGGENVLDCIQCGVCAGSCPVGWAMDFYPLQINKLIHLGMKDVVLSSSTIWLCASCYTCATRCPRGIDIPTLMSSLKNMAIRENFPAKIAIKPKFHKSFTEVIKIRGRLHEPDLFMMLTRKTDMKAMWKNALLGLRLWRKGKLKLVASEVNEKSQLRSLFEEVEITKEEPQV